MHKDNYDLGSLGRELTDEELMQIQGGGFWGDVWNGVKKAGQAVVDAIEVILYPKPKPDPFPLPIPRPKPPFPLPPGF